MHYVWDSNLIKFSWFLNIRSWQNKYIWSNIILFRLTHSREHNDFGTPQPSKNWSTEHGVIWYIQGEGGRRLLGKCWKIEQSHNSHSAPIPFLTMYHFGIEVVRIFVPKWCIIWDRRTVGFVRLVYYHRSINLLHKSRNAPVPYPTMSHCVT